jgi:hypothetical protein
MEEKDYEIAKELKKARERPTETSDATVAVAPDLCLP